MLDPKVPYQAITAPFVARLPGGVHFSLVSKTWDGGNLVIGVVARPDKREEMPSCVSLGRNRDFNLLLAGQVVSDLGARVSGIAFPLLTLGLTGSPAKAGLVAFAQTLPLLVLTLPAGALVDRADRKRVMVVADCCRCLALASLVLALALDRLAFAHVVLVALVDGIGFVFFNVGERSALRSVVPDRQLGQALARNQSREYTALLAGPPWEARCLRWADSSRSCSTPPPTPPRW